MSPLLNLGLSPRPSSERFRYQQPKRFWAALFMGSVGLHLAALWLAPLWWRSLSPPSAGGSGTAPTPVELIDASELGGVALDAANPSAPALTGGAAATGTPITTAPTAVPQTAPAAPTSQLVPQPFMPQPNPSFTGATPISPQPPADFSNVPAPTPLPQQAPPQAPLPSQPTPAQQPQPGQGFPSTFPGDSFPGGDSSVVTGRPLPSPGDVPDPANSAEEAGVEGERPGGATDEANGSDGLGDVATSGEVGPSRGVASLTPGTALPSDATADIPEVLPQPEQTSLEFTSDPTDPNSCIITPDSQVAFGEPISLRLVIDVDGRVIDAFGEGESPNPAYTDLARCVVIQNWRFQPATTGGVPQQSNFLVTLSIQAVP